MKYIQNISVGIKRNEDLFPRWHSFFDNDWLGFPGFMQKDDSIPAVNIKDAEDSYEIEMAAPGMKKKDFEVNLKKQDHHRSVNLFVSKLQAIVEETIITICLFSGLCLQNFDENGYFWWVPIPDLVSKIYLPRL